MADVWGLILPSGHPLAEKSALTLDDIAGLPLFCSGQAWEHEIAAWAGNQFDRLSLEGSFRLSYNGAVFAREGLGYLLTFDHLIDTSKESGLVFRPLTPRLETKLYLVWNKYQTFTPIAERFLHQIQTSFSASEHFPK